jgi:hypothetical protein
MIYLRPEANGVKVESTLLKVIRDDSLYKGSLKMVYLANIPGDFIVEKRVVEEHYALKIRFAREGRRAFTETMQKRFEGHFKVPFGEARVLGAFEAMKALDMSEEELIHIWVPLEQMTHIHGQSIKKYEEAYIVNYDIPALLLKNSPGTDIFSMILRSALPYSRFHEMIRTASLALKQEKILTNPKLYSHVFHYSKGPFEQILDSIGYVYIEGERHIDLSQICFFDYLLSGGSRKEEIIEAIRSPIMSFRTGAGDEERDLFTYTYEDSYAEASRKFESRIT